MEISKLLPQRLPNEKMEDYFHRTALEAGATFENGVYNAGGSITSHPYTAWYIQLYSVKLKKKNQH